MHIISNNSYHPEREIQLLSSWKMTQIEAQKASVVQAFVVRWQNQGQKREFLWTRNIVMCYIMTFRSETQHIWQWSQNIKMELKNSYCLVTCITLTSVVMLVWISLLCCQLDKSIAIYNYSSRLYCLGLCMYMYTLQCLHKAEST